MSVAGKSKRPALPTKGGQAFRRLPPTSSPTAISHFGPSQSTRHHRGRPRQTKSQSKVSQTALKYN